MPLLIALIVAGFIIGCCALCGPGFYRRNFKRRAPVADIQVAGTGPVAKPKVDNDQRRLSVRVASALGLSTEPSVTEGGEPSRRLSTRVGSVLEGQFAAYPKMSKKVSSVASKLGVSWGETQVVPLAQARNEQVSLVEMAVEPDPQQQPPHGVAPPKDEPRDGYSRRTSGGDMRI